MSVAGGVRGLEDRALRIAELWHMLGFGGLCLISSPRVVSRKGGGRIDDEDELAFRRVWVVETLIFVS